jgi:hypothetical protein
VYLEKCNDALSIWATAGFFCEGLTGRNSLWATVVQGGVCGVGCERHPTHVMKCLSY